MQAVVPEREKKPGLCYAVTDDGIELPIIDVTHPAFANRLSERQVNAVCQAYRREAVLRSKLPAWARRMLVRFLAKRSVLLRSALARKSDRAPGSGVFLSGTATYLMKLGPDNLGRAYASPLDRKLAAALPPLATRLRLHDISRMLGEGLVRALARRAVREIDLINIGGGSAIDSLNALIVAHKEYAGRLTSCRVRIFVLDGDEAGPRFGARALHALREPGGPLAGLDISFHHVPHDWTKPETLRAWLGKIRRDQALLVGSSEGALFDYGSDDTIVDNLNALREKTGPDFFLVGSVIRDEELAHLIQNETELSFRPLGLKAFGALAANAGWAIERVFDNPTNFNVRLLKR